ncbi:bifunctional diaminohydroxyphosphoribosylaminopyrimidine deaminase/5-amino-6-(5-phosphoribosylamino)uracil reductase RibD [Nitrosomonas sp. Nm33]|uniref:bifunctional diaminohydroxyphosphoribosylaminopyrimidine deaminase/5-amino-6-(5-phosphoribosylamino)uracil reductase RibD n=1 Tax=Nitrosomonas sp. Nm33 TaxID=133724 RepID=UPI00089D480C|nr:bifunctional diaminohydroxyphosphoribosylaminopyrimidine deaminase/5-amino-6-(5-phosphoribosylamino)uracil reductase RibD [Nitrosomonas sp. Nm33]SDY60679.1 diaminohydroxyphosphoribosylaminopyrimidine deaminase / 5-amino-6-(5-phosphoribosylamino)uracil reductase [Nitrosomonas sp. Nm33]
MLGDSPIFSSTDYAFMAQALKLAEKGLYTTSPNPRVGCVIVKNNRVIGSGWHERAGQPHAEINALYATDGTAENATVYVTLEPCSHYGRTPPCAQTLINAGVAKVVIAMLDPNPLVAGSGAAMLRQTGIMVQSGLLEEQARALNIGFVSRMVRHRPWVRLKIAASLDGKTALENGESQWITNKAARLDGHRLRALSCAILTGVGTVKKDDPQLTVRHVETSRQPLRVVIDSRLEISTNAKLLHGGKVLIFSAVQDENRKKSLEEKGAKVIIMPGAGGKVHLTQLMAKLADFEINEVLVEAGSTLAGALVQEGLVDELVIYLAPCLLGDKAQGMLNLPMLTKLSDKRKLELTDFRMIGQDIRVTAKFSSLEQYD